MKIIVNNKDDEIENKVYVILKMNEMGN